MFLVAKVFDVFQLFLPERLHPTCIFIGFVEHFHCQFLTATRNPRAATALFVGMGPEDSV